MRLSEKVEVLNQRKKIDLRRIESRRIESDKNEWTKEEKVYRKPDRLSDEDGKTFEILVSFFRRKTTSRKPVRRLERSTDKEQIEREGRRRPTGRRFDEVEDGLVEWDRWSGRPTDEEKRDLKEAESLVDEKGRSTSGQFAKTRG
jgi:hypothetical protein